MWTDLVIWLKVYINIREIDIDLGNQKGNMGPGPWVHSMKITSINQNQVKGFSREEIKCSCSSWHRTDGYPGSHVCATYS